MNTRRLFLLQVAGLSLSPLALKKFVDALPIPPIARPESKRRYRIVMGEFQAQVHRDLPPTSFWGYNGMSPGPTFETRSGEAITVEWVNHLPAKHLFSIDHAVHGAEQSFPEVRTVVHLHGGKTPPESDGNPEKWLVPGQSKICSYPNHQPAAALFYHDHAMGITRLNAIAGLFGMYLIRDPFEDSLQLPSGPHEIPLCIYDRLFTVAGQLQYPRIWTHEFYGNAILLNGKLFPFLSVEPRPYRFRILNCSNAGFYTLSFSKDDLNLVPGKETFQVIGSDQGLLPERVALKSLEVIPGARADVIVDFTNYAGTTLYLKHTSEPIMQFRVAAKTSLPASPNLPTKLRPVARTPESAAIKTRRLTLVDRKNAAGHPTLMLLNDAHYDMPVTEKPALDSTEIWTLINLTDDTHPIHLHLVRFQILDRQRFDFEIYQKTGKLVFTGPPLPPAPPESAWKDTVRADVLMVTRIIVKFEGYKGRYVWHCHVLEHEDNEMMRPFEVV